MRATWLSRRRLLLPKGGRLPGGVWMHAACRPLAVFANTVTGHLTRVSTGLVPATQTRLELPFHEGVLAGILDRVPQLRRDYDWVVLSPSDSRRARIMILGLDEQRVADVFVKATLDEPNPLAVRLLEELGKTDSTLVFPRVKDLFQLDDWWVTVEEPLPQLPHRPARLDPARLHALATTIHGLLPPQNGMVCSHGDFGPWNVRRFSGPLLGVIDWEYANWSPMAADELWYALTLRLATTSKAGERVGESTRKVLGQLYPDQEIRRAAEFIVAQRSGPEPREIRDGVERSRSLLEFEGRIAAAFSVLTD